jgi:2-oxoglutarate ferredoxin oxidoreductase subunit delta
MSEKKKKANIIINPSWCKGCEICVYFCPTGAIKMEKDKVVIADEYKCTACMLCEISCPDFAIEIEKL